MSDFTICKCAICGMMTFEKFMLEYNGRYYCGLPHRLQQERKDNEAIDRALGRTVVEFRSPGTNTTDST